MRYSHVINSLVSAPELTELQLNPQSGAIFGHQVRAQCTCAF